MKYFLSFIILNFSICFGQNFILRGRVTDSLSNEPIERAVIFISSKFLTYADVDGYYKIEGLSKGAFNVEIVQLGYESFSGIINIPEDSLKNFHLLPSPIELGEVIVSTSRTDKLLRNSPYSELLVGSNLLQNQAYQSLPEALKNEAGISLISEGPWGTEVSIRG
ncbi:MAG: carboxypeptidase-like regulatory domain-containing protein, partial [Ignavibacteria bacterium]